MTSQIAKISFDFSGSVSEPLVSSLYLAETNCEQIQYVFPLICSPKTSHYLKNAALSLCDTHNFNYAATLLHLRRIKHLNET